MLPGLDYFRFQFMGKLTPSTQQFDGVCKLCAKQGSIRVHESTGTVLRLLMTYCEPSKTRHNRLQVALAARLVPKQTADSMMDVRVVLFGELGALRSVLLPGWKGCACTTLQERMGSLSRLAVSGVP